MLSYGVATAAIASMVEVWVLHRLVFQTSMTFLAAKDSVALQSFLVVKPFSINIAFAFKSNIKQLKGSSLPKVVARIH